MRISTLSRLLNIEMPPKQNSMLSYKKLRNNFILMFQKSVTNKFQSPSIKPTTDIQRSNKQNKKEYSVYQRADFTPLTVENSFNKIFKSLGSIEPQTLFFNSGMAAISTLMFYLKNTRKLQKLVIGENAYFETKWLCENYKKTKYINEYKFEIPQDTDILWLEYPINCTQPNKYPFDKQLNLQKMFSEVTKLSKQRKEKKIVLVIDYTLYYLSPDLLEFLKKIPKNLEIYLVTSLQKHRSYGLDLTNGGAITFYSGNEVYEALSKLRTITGTNITQETVWSMPRIDEQIINKLIKDSGTNAEKMYKKIKKHSFDGVTFHYSLNKTFNTSFIFVTLEKKLMHKSSDRPFSSNLLINEIIKSAKRNKAILVQGTSFGLPFTRIFKNSERYENTNSLRIAVGYDRMMNKNVSESIIQGTYNFIDSIIK